MVGLAGLSTTESYSGPAMSDESKGGGRDSPAKPWANRPRWTEARIIKRVVDKPVGRTKVWAKSAWVAKYVPLP